MLMLKCYERKNIVDSAKQGLTDSALLFFHCKKRRQSLVHRLLRPRGVKQAIYVEWTHFMKTFVLHLHRQQGVSRGPTAHKRMNWNARGQRQPTAPYLQPIYKQEYACLLQIKEEKILWLGTVAKKRKKNGSIIGDEVHAEEIFAWASRGNLKWKTKNQKPYHQWWRHPAGQPHFPLHKMAPCPASLLRWVPRALPVSDFRCLSIKFSVANWQWKQEAEKSGAGCPLGRHAGFV